MTSKPVDLFSGDAALNESDAEQVRRVVAVLGKERAAALFEEAKARAARGGDPEAGAAPAETLARRFFDLVWERADPAYVRWIFAPPEPPQPPIDEGQFLDPLLDWSQPPPPLLLSRPSGMLVGCMSVFVAVEHLLAALLAASMVAGNNMVVGLTSCGGCPYGSVGQDEVIRPIAWLLWLLVLIGITSCVVGAALSRSPRRWLLWFAALLAPVFWYVIATQALISATG